MIFHHLSRGFAKKNVFFQKYFRKTKRGAKIAPIGLKKNPKTPWGVAPNPT